MTITEFLLARIAEDKANVEGDWSWGDGGLHIISTRMSERMLAECEAKRKIVEALGDFEDGYVWGSGEASRAEDALFALASVYADHPDFDEAWRI